MWETLDAEVLHDLFDLLLQVEHFGLEFRSLRRFGERERVRVLVRVSVPAYTTVGASRGCINPF